MIGRCAFGRAPLLACPKSLAARASFGRDHRCLFHIDDVNVHLTGVAFAGSHIFTLSTFGSAIQARGRLGQQRTSSLQLDSAIPVTTPEPPGRAEAEGAIGHMAGDEFMSRPDPRPLPFRISRSLLLRSLSIRAPTGDLSKPSRSTSFAMSRLATNSRVPDICWSRPNAPSATTVKRSSRDYRGQIAGRGAAG